MLVNAPYPERFTCVGPNCGKTTTIGDWCSVTCYRLWHDQRIDPLYNNIDERTWPQWFGPTL